MVLFYNRESIKNELFLLCLLAGITLFYMIIRFFVMVNTNVEPLVYPGGRFLSNVYTMATVFGGYIKLLFAPVSLLADYSVEAKRKFFDCNVILSFTVILPLFIVSVYCFFKKRALWALGWIWFFVCLAPVSNLVKIVNIFAERYLYFALIGFCFFIVSLLNRFFKVSGKAVLVAVMFLFLVLSARSILRNYDWNDTVSLWNSTMKVEPDSHRALSNIATYYFQQGDYKNAIKNYLACLQKNKNPQNRYNLANCYMAIKDYKQAVIEFNKALETGSSYPEIYNNLSLAYLYLGELPKAEEVLRQSLKYTRPDSTYYENLGLIKDKQGNHKSAIVCFEKALALNSRKPSIYNKLGVSYYQIGEERKALDYWFEGVELFPRNPFFYKNLAVYYHEKNDLDNELFYWEKTHDVAPIDVAAIKNLISLYHRKSNQTKVDYYLNELNKIEKGMND